MAHLYYSLFFFILPTLYIAKKLFPALRAFSIRSVRIYQRMSERGRSSVPSRIIKASDPQNLVLKFTERIMQSKYNRIKAGIAETMPFFSDIVQKHLQF